jgi:hypothetical protein
MSTGKGPSEVVEDEREAFPSIGAPGGSSRRRRSRECDFRSTEQERMRDHSPTSRRPRLRAAGNESLAETLGRAFGMNNHELRQLIAGPVEAFNAKLQSL